MMLREVWASQGQGKAKSKIPTGPRKPRTFPKIIVEEDEIQDQVQGSLEQDLCLKIVTIVQFTGPLVPNSGFIEL